MQDQGQGEGDHLQKQEQQQEQQQHQRQPAQPSAIRTPPRSPLPSAMNTTTKIAAGSSPSSLLLPRPSAVGNANRGVSWDLQQQQLVGNRPRAESTSSYSSKHFTLNDVIRNTPELEAETYLLRAVEKITGQAHQRTNTETSRLFNTIAAEELTSADLAQNDNFTSTTSTSTSNPVPNQSRANTGTSVASAKEGATTRTNANANANHTKPAPGVARAKFKSLVKKIQEQEANKSVEHTLFGLSHALAEMSKTSSAHKKSRYDSSVLEDERENDSTFKATDKLVQTVDNAIHKSKEEEEEEEKEIDVDAFIMDVETGGTGPENSTDMDSEPTDTDDLSGSPTNNNNNNNNNNDNADGTKNKNRKKRRKRRHKGAQLLNTAQDGLRVDWELFNEFLGGKKATIKNYVRTAVLFVVIPSLLLSIILFEFVESPETDANGNVIPGQKATPSWWILYFGMYSQAFWESIPSPLSEPACAHSCPLFLLHFIRSAVRT